MLWKVLNVAACLLTVASPILLHGQGADAQDVTQSIFDQHKGADPTNSDRALTDKVKQSDVRIEQVPLPTLTPAKPAVARRTLKEIRDLQQQKKDFIKKRIEEDKKKMAATMKFAEVDEAQTAKQSNEAWEKTEAGRTLRKLEAEAKAREKTEVKISTVPLPSRSN